MTPWPHPSLSQSFSPLSLGLPYPSLTVANNSVLCLFAIRLVYIVSWFLSVVNLCLICNISIIPFFFLPLKHWNRGPESQLQSYHSFLCSFPLLFSVCNIRYSLTSFRTLCSLTSRSLTHIFWLSAFLHHLWNVVLSLGSLIFLESVCVGGSCRKRLRTCWN